MRTISDLSREYEVPRPSITAVLDEHDVPTYVVGKARCVRDEDMPRVAPVLSKLRSKARARRREAAASA